MTSRSMSMLILLSANPPADRVPRADRGSATIQWASRWRRWRLIRVWKSAA